MTENKVPENRPGLVVRVRRFIAAPPQDVYRAWLDPDMMRTWFAPSAYRVEAVEVDERVGGRISIRQCDESGASVGGNESVIVELVPNQRIVLRFRFVGPGRAIDTEPETLLTVTMALTDDGGTLVELVHERLDQLRAERPDIADQVELGWQSALDNLSAALSPQP